jgi:hypothetical protein
MAGVVDELESLKTTDVFEMGAAVMDLFKLAHCKHPDEAQRPAGSAHDWCVDCGAIYDGRNWFAPIWTSKAQRIDVIINSSTPLHPVVAPQSVD